MIILKGLISGKIQQKLAQYADDTFLFLDGNENSLRECILVFNRFYICSGLKMNLDKTQAVWLGAYKHRQNGMCLDLNIKWVTRFTSVRNKF